MSPLSPEMCRAARAILLWGQRDLAARAKVGLSTITSFEMGTRQPYERTLEALRRTFEDAGLQFIDPVEGEGGEGVRFKWGVAPPAQQPGEDTATGEPGEGGLKAAWDDIEEATDADLDALLSEPSAPNPDMAELWRADPQAWERLSQIGRETLSRSMFGDCRAAAEGYFRGGHHAG